MRVLARSTPILFMVGALLVSLITAPVAAQPSRSQVGKAVQAAMTYARTLPDVFGGLWLTDRGAVFAFTHRATDAQIEDVLSRIKPGIPVTTVRVEWSEAELDATQDAIVDFVQIQGPPQVLTGVGTDIVNNAVLVGILPEYFEVCQAGLTARFAPVRLLFESSGPDRGLPEPTPTPDATPSPTSPPEWSLPPACLPPSSPGPSGTPIDPPLPVDCRTEFPDLTGGREVPAEELMRLCRDAYLSSGVDRVSAYAKTQPDFAGLVVRRGIDPGWTIWFTTDLARHQAELEPLTPKGRTVTLLPAELTLRELEAIQERVSTDLPELLAMGMRIEEVGVDPRRNAVVVGLREDSPGALLILQRLYGPHVVTEGVGAT
jgi:hypothetical protein